MNEERGRILPTKDPDDLAVAVTQASDAIRQGDLIVLPTDTVYGVAADAFDADAVNGLLTVKGRGREMPPPVLVSAVTTLDALATQIPEWARALVQELWPGPLTVVCHHQPSLTWDLGETLGTVAVRMPADPAALAVLERTGPLAVSSANRHGLPPARTAAQAFEQLGTRVALYLDGGERTQGVPSAIIDATSQVPRILRQGAVGLARLDELLAPFSLSVSPEATPSPDGVGGRSDA